MRFYVVATQFSFGPRGILGVSLLRERARLGCEGTRVLLALILFPFEKGGRFGKIVLTLLPNKTQRISITAGFRLNKGANRIFVETKFCASLVFRRVYSKKKKWAARREKERRKERGKERAKERAKEVEEAFYPQPSENSGGICMPLRRVLCIQGRSAKSPKRKKRKKKGEKSG